MMGCTRLQVHSHIQYIFLKKAYRQKHNRKKNKDKKTKTCQSTMTGCKSTELKPCRI